MKNVELLAPAGDIDSLYAAVQNGADAVYVGGTKFSARAYASNFNEENLIKGVEYCHLYKVKIYVTVNTLVKEKEILDFLEYIKFLYEIGIDALIIQDIGVAKLIKDNFPKFPIHASTQMTVHNVEGALLLERLGFARIVLARELTLKEIEYISKKLSIETEIFIHGALCVCYSGQCLMSSLIGGRSGNRGRCAQPCRLPYEIINKSSNIKSTGYILSPKDICTLDNIKDIIKSGTSSLKIEGRMKRPEYVAGVVSAYRKVIDEFYHGLNFDKDKEEKKLLQLFNREGFSKGYILKNWGKDMMSYNFPKNTGIKLGKVRKDLTIRLEEDITLQDGVRFKNQGFTVSKIIKDSKSVDEAFKGDIVKLKPIKYRSGDILYKTLNSNLMLNLRNSYENIYKMRKIHIDLEVIFKVGEPFTLSTYYDNKEYKVQGDVVDRALKKPVEKEQLIKNIIKTKDTAFTFDSIEFSYFESGFIPVSSVNSARRQLLSNIEKDLKQVNKRKYEGDLNLSLDFNKDKKTFMDSPLVVVTTKEQLKAALELGYENIAIDFFMRDCDISLENVNCNNIYIKTSSIVKEEFEQVCDFIEENLCNIKGIITSNLGIINRFKDKTLILGDYKLNIFNKYSLDFYKDIIDGTTLSVELNKKEIQGLVKDFLLPCSLMIYGKIELMVSEHCPIGSVFGGKDIKNNCNGECSKGEFILKDRIGKEMSIKTDRYCRCHIYNYSPVNLIPNLGEIRAMNNISYLRADFTDESYSKTKNILESLKREDFKEDFKNYTRGHFKRGVE